MNEGVYDGILFVSKGYQNNYSCCCTIFVCPSCEPLSLLGMWLNYVILFSPELQALPQDKTEMFLNNSLQCSLLPSEPEPEPKCLGNECNYFLQNEAVLLRRIQFTVRILLKLNLKCSWWTSGKVWNLNQNQTGKHLVMHQITIYHTQTIYIRVYF